MLKTAPKNRTISYLRTQWADSIQPQIALQEVLGNCLSPVNYGDSELPLRDGHAQIRHWSQAGQTLCIHMAAWTDREPVSIVPHLHASGPDLSEAPPGKDWDYLDGDGMMLLKGDHCLFMPSGLHPKTMEQYLKNLLVHARDQGAAIPLGSDRFALLAIGDSNVLEDVHVQGIKSIQLNVGQFHETARAREERHETLVQHLRRELLSTLFSREEDRRKVEEAENVHASLIVKINSRKRGLTPEELAPIGRQLLDESEDDVEIVTERGQRIRRGALLLRKTVQVSAFAKTVHHNHAWELMNEYFQELEESGALDL